MRPGGTLLFTKKNKKEVHAGIYGVVCDEKDEISMRMMSPSADNDVPFCEEEEMMEEGANSWIRRTKFSHTVCHRLDSSRLASLTLNIQPERISDFKSRPGTAPSFSSQKSPIHRNSSTSHFQRNPITNKQRAVSPLPRMILSDTFKEARSEKKRFLTPHARRKDQEKRIVGKLFHKESQHAKPSNNLSNNSSPLRNLSSMKEKSKTKSEFAWTNYFYHNGGKVNALEAADKWSIDMSKLFLGLKFAHGAHSRLYHGLYKDEPVAVKIIRVPDDDENGTFAARLEKQFVREVTILSQLHHPNVIKFIAACRNPPVHCIITEYLPKGSLRAYLHKLEQKSLPLQKIIEIALDISRGMEYIHSQGFIHRDLKPENVLIDEHFHLKIADFGIACGELYCDSLADDPGTYRWMAPEMIKKKSYGRKVDVYSFGLILWEMVAGTIPYEEMIPIQAAFAVVNKNLRPVIPGDCPPCMRALIEQCWSVHSEKRPEFWQIVKVLEQFESSLAQDRNLNLVPSPACQDHKKGLLHWIQKLGTVPPPNGASISKPKFT